MKTNFCLTNPRALFTEKKIQPWVSLVHSLLLLLVAGHLSAVPPWVANPGSVGEPFELRSSAAILLESGTVLHEQSADQVYPIASLTKLMTLYLALESASQGTFDLSAMQVVPEASLAENQPRGSSLMFLSSGYLVRGIDLLYGLIVSSGNDAAVALAIILAGSQEAFVQRMNSTAEHMGLTATRYVDPSGFGAGNLSSSRDVAMLVQDLLQRWPETVSMLGAAKTFTYPTPRHRIPGANKNQYPILNGITQESRNRLLWEYNGANGLKTGFTEEARYTLAATADRNGRQLILVLLSVPGSSHIEGSRNRTQDANILFDYGFKYFDTRAIKLPSIHAYIPGGNVLSVALKPQGEQHITLPRSLFADLLHRIEPGTLQWAPLPAETAAATAVYVLGKFEVLTVPLVTADPVGKGNLFRRLRDALRWWNRKESILVFAEE